MSKMLQIEMEDDVFLGMQKEPTEFGCELRLAAAAKWYEMGVVSQDKAAEIAGLDRAEFLMALSRMQTTPFQETAAEALEGMSPEKQ